MANLAAPVDKNTIVCMTDTPLPIVQSKIEVTGNGKNCYKNLIAGAFLFSS